MITTGLVFSILEGALVGLVASIVWPRTLLEAGITLAVTGACGFVAPFLLERLFTELGLMRSLSVYGVFGIEAGKVIIAASLAVLNYASVFGGLVGLSALAIIRRGPPRNVSRARRLGELATAAGLLVGGYLILLVLGLLTLGLMFGVWGAK